MKIFIVAHDQDLILNFKKGDYNNYDFILVGKNPDYSKLISPETPFTIIPSLESRNIENLPRLLTFTAWHYIANIPEIELCEDYIGIFEYDIKIHKNLDELKCLLNRYSIISFQYLSVNHVFSFSKTPGLFNAIKKVYNIDAERLIAEYSLSSNDFVWAPTTNHIMPVKYLKGFVDWYMRLIPEIFKYENYPHFHERALKIYSILNGYDYVYPEGYITHDQLGSHKIPLFPEQYGNV